MKIVKFNPIYSLNTEHRKENNFSKGYKVLDSKFNTLVDCRIYWTNTSCYCCIWAYGNGHHLNGSAVARGYGYHKESSAVNLALIRAGVEFSESWGGAGSDHINKALMLVGKKINNNKKVHLVTCFG